MNSTLAPKLTIVINPTGLTVEESEKVLAMAHAAAADVEYEISIATANLADDPVEDDLTWLRPGSRLTVFTYESTHPSSACSLNTAIAAGSSELVLVLEQGVALPPFSVAKILAEWDRSTADWLSIPVWDEDTSGEARHNGEMCPFFAETAAFLVGRGDLLRIRGYDERGDLGSVASSDLRVRLNRAGLVSEQANTRAYLWGIGRPITSLSEREIKSRVSEDPSIYRNLTNWSVPTELRPVLVSVAIATRDRAEYLRDSINSVLNQTFQDFEIIIVDDGSTDETELMVASYADPRIRYLYQEPAGISAARNVAADGARGFFTAVHDDDDIMLPDRLEIGLRSLTEDHDASYGSWVNFDNETAKLVLHVIRDGFDADLVAFNGQGPGHATWLVPTSMIRHVRYDDTFSASVDHNLATRLAWSGCRWVHTGHVAYLRRMHSSQVSETDGSNQKIGHVLTCFANEFVASMSDRSAMRATGEKHVNPMVPGRTDLASAFGAWLPDRLVSRTAIFRGNVSNKLMKLARYSAVSVMLTERDLSTGRLVAEIGFAAGVTWKDMISLRASGETSYELESVILPSQAVDAGVQNADVGAVTLAQIVRDHLGQATSAFPLKNKPVWFVAVGGVTDKDQALFADAQRKTRLVVASNHERFRADIFGYRSRESVPSASRRLLELVGNGSLFVIDPASTTPADAAANAAFILKEI